jgi:hypothetical protein
LLLFLTGGPSHIDTLDPKPDAPADVRGSFRPIATRLPGVYFCEHLPFLAARADRLAVVRTMALRSAGLGVHERATPLVLAGIDAAPPGSGLQASRHDWPCYAAGLHFARPRADGLPSGVTLPLPLSNYAGQNAGMLGPRHDPWQLHQNPNDPRFRAAALSLPAGLSLGRLSDRQQLLARVEHQRTAWERMADQLPFTRHQRQAFDVLASGRLTEALALEREPDRVRDGYGRHLFGQSLLLARRIVQAGVPVVQVNMGFVAQWDTHTNNCRTLKDQLLPPLDRALAALLDDLAATGLLDETLVVMIGEFGRTPKLGGNVGTPSFSPDGRDHWTNAFSAVFAGGGIRGGQVVGQTDRLAAFPKTRPYYPSDLGATVYAALGLDPDVEVRDGLGRPLRLNQGEVMTPLFRGV